MSKEFSPLRSVFWPIHRNEIRKFVPMMLLMFFICFNYSILRNLKDAIVITAESAGAEVIPFIKVWVLLPSAVLLTVIFTKLCNRYSQETVFYIFISGFITFFAIFAFLIYPLREVLHPHQMADHLETLLPMGLKGFIAMFRNWSFTIFYVVCELWSSAVLTVLFWGFANEITKINEAPRFYGLLSVVANTSAIIAGLSANYLVYESWETTLDVLVTVIILFGIFSMLIFRWMNKNVLTDASFDALHQSRKEFKKKERLSLKESFNFLSNSKYLVCIAVLVLSYNLIINLVEIVWKNQLFQLHPSPGDYNVYMNNMTAIIGCVSVTASLFMPKLISRFGWTSTAMITPLIMLITSIGFFSFMLFQDTLAAPMVLWIGATPLALSVFFGMAQVCLSKASKFSVFDATKEMAFIPLDHDVKLKGKAAIDGVGSRLGKSGGSLIHQGLLMYFGSLAASAPYVAVIILFVIVAWLYTVRSLGRQVHQLADKRLESAHDTDPSLL
jgi:ATP:ADP antiporter, AAA family